MGKQRRDRTGHYRYDKPVHVLRGHGAGLVPTLGTCARDRGKVVYATRADAKKICKRHNLDHPVEPYRCTVNPAWWHVGGKARDPEPL